MLKQICIKSINTSHGALIKMYKEAQTYLQNIGFQKIPLISITDKDATIRSFLFSQGLEKVLIEYKKDKTEEILRLIFDPLEIKFIYDILLMRFNQIASKEESVFIYH